MRAPALPPHEVRRLERLRRLRVLDTAAEEVLDGFTRLAASVTGMPIALVSLVDADRQWFKSAVGLPQGGQIPRDLSFCGHAILQDGVFEVEDARQDARFAGNPLVDGAPHVVHYAGAPLVLPEGERIGTLCLIDRAPGRLAGAHRELLTGLAANVVNVLLLRESERELLHERQQRNELLEAIIEHLPAGLTVFDSQLNHVVSNTRLRRKLQLPDHLFEPPHVSFRDLAIYLAGRGEYGPGDIDQLVEQRVALMRQPNYQGERVLADGRTVEVRAQSTPGGHVITTYVDVTSARRATAQLQAGRERLALALDASEMGLWEYDASAQVVSFWGRWAGLLGLPAQTEPGYFASLLPPEEVDRFVAARTALLKGQVSRLSLEHRLRTEDGRVVWVLTEGQVTERSPDGRAGRLVGTVKNISERRQADQALRSAVEAADEANRAKSDFLATMSHEIRTPINGVIGLTQLLTDARLPASESNYVQMIDSCAKSLLSLVDNILDFSKIEAGKVAVVDARTDLRELVREVSDVFTVRAAEKDIDFTVNVDPLVPAAVQLDAARVRQVLLNLLGNACKFTSAGGFSLRVLLLAAHSGPRLQFVVSDTGIGIAEADQPRLFTRFTQADGSARRRFQGTGLGLAISRELARLMGGDVHLASRLGAGSTFTLELPLREVEPPAPPAALRRADGARTDAAILLVEDNDVNRLVAQGLLASLGYHRVSAAVHGGLAVAACEGQAFDLVLMDCQMPEMDGFQATAELRARGHRMPIVALTAHALAGDRERCLQAGMDDYLTKPIEPRALAEKLHRWLSRDAGPEKPVSPAPSAPASAAPAYDPAALAERFSGDHLLFGRAREIFVARTGPALHAIAAAGSGGDARALQQLAHQLHGSAATIGAARLAQLCARLEAEGPRVLAGPERWVQQAQAALDGFLAESG